MWLDKTMNKILSETEVHFEGRVNRDQIREAFFIYWKTIAAFLKEVRFPRIHIPKFGYFEPKIKYMKSRLRSFELDEEKWGEYREYLYNTTENAIERITLEKIKRKRKNGKF